MISIDMLLFYSITYHSNDKKLPKVGYIRITSRIKHFKSSLLFVFGMRTSVGISQQGFNNTAL